MKPENLVIAKNNFSRYGTIISFISNVLTEAADTDKMHKMLYEFNSEINELKVTIWPDKMKRLMKSLKMLILFITIN